MREYILIRSKRKTIALYVRGGKLEVRAPLKAPKAAIDAFIEAKEEWISKHLQKQEIIAEKRSSFSLSYGDSVLCRGKEYPIVARDGNRAGFDHGENCLFVPPKLSPNEIKAAVIEVYKLLAKRITAEKIAYFQRQMNVCVSSIKINSAKKRWGSMSAKHSVNFSWRLMMADDDLIDLVVVHELAHIKQMNHSDKFWAEVEAILPDWREREKRLKEVSLMINEQDWEIAEDETKPSDEQHFRWHFADYKTILSPKNGMNIYRGCTHGCIYCDSRSDCYQMKHDFEDIEVKRNAPVMLDQQLSKKRKPCMISTGAMCDPYLHLEAEIGYTRKCLEVIEKHDCGVSLLTKSALVMRDLDVLKRINSKTKAVVQMTLTTFDEKLCRILEPNVSTTAERFRVLEAMRDNGIPTVVWLTPILPFINDTEENIRGILDYCVRAQVKAIICFGIGVTLRDGDREYFYQKLDEHFPALKQKYIRAFGNSYEIPSPKADRLYRIVQNTCEKNGIMLDTNDVFSYLSEFPTNKNSDQLSFFN